jgi:type VI secretion system secreted protein VgrG
MADAVQQAAAKAWVEVILDPNPGYTLLFDGMRGREALGEPFFYEVDLSSGVIREKIGDLIGSSCTVWLSQSAEGSVERYFNGIITRIVAAGMVAGAYRYKVDIRPWYWLLSRQVETRIFQKKSPFKIITDEIFKIEGFEYDDKRQNSAGDVELEYCVQYNESTFDFVQRLMEQYGLYYYFTHTKESHKLHITDDQNAGETISDAIPFTYDQTGYQTVRDHIWQWANGLLLQAGKVTYRDYNFLTPAADLTAKAVKAGSHPKHNDYEVYEYPVPYLDAAAGNKLTDIHMQAIDMHRLVVEGATNARSIHPGWRFTLKDHPTSSVNKEYLITKTEFEVAMSEGSTGEESETLDTYRAAFAALPGDMPFRLSQNTPRPYIRGPQTAKVVVKNGEEIDTDEHGRVLVKFHWDRADLDDDKRTCRIRVAQSMAGSGWGTMFIPRKDQEVIVEFLEGNPDRPLIIGTVYNATNKPPYALPANQTMTTIKTNSSKGGGGYNELTFEDKKDAEVVTFQAQKDYNKTVLNNEVVKIKKDTTTTVEEGNRSVTVAKGDDTHKVDTGKRTTTIKGDDALTVSSGNHKVDISAGKSEVTAAQSMTHTVGGSSVKLEPAAITITMGGSSIKIEAAQITITSGANSIKLDTSGITVKGTPMLNLN